MPVISSAQFIRLADRLAATYGLLVQAEKKYMAPAEPPSYQTGQSYPARLLLDLTGTGTQVLLTANVTGISGNSIYFSIVSPSTANAPLASISLGTNLVLSLSTDANSKPNTTVEAAIDFLQNTSDFTDHISVIYPVSGVGGYVQPWPMLPLSGGEGGGEVSPSLFTIAMTQPNAAGSTYTLTMNHPSAANQAFEVCWNKTDLVIDLPTNGASALTMTLGEFKTALEAATSDFVVITDSPGTLAPAVATTSFSSGSTGSFVEVVLTPPPGSSTVDPAVVTGLVAPAQALDTGFTAMNLSNGLSYINAFQGALAQHFVLVGYPGGMAGFMDDNNILVHKNFSTVTFNRTGNTNIAASVFRPDQVVLGTVAQEASAITLTTGTALGTGQGNQSETNYGPQVLVAVLAPENGTSLAATWEFTLDLIDLTGAVVTSDKITFNAGDPVGHSIPITAATGTFTKFYAVNAATQVTAGTDGDSVFITQVVERQITL